MKKVIIKDTIMKTMTLTIGFVLLAYVVWLFLQGQQVATSIETNMTALSACAALALFLLVLTFRPRLVTTNRWILGLIGVITVLLAHSWLVDDPAQMIYLRDVVILVWVYLTITGPTKMLVPKKVQEALADEKVEIIEV